MEFAIVRKGEFRNLPDTGIKMYSALRRILDEQAGGSLWSEYSFTVKREALIKYKISGVKIRFRLLPGDVFKHWR